MKPQRRPSNFAQWFRGDPAPIEENAEPAEDDALYAAIAAAEEREWQSLVASALAQPASDKRSAERAHHGRDERARRRKGVRRLVPTGGGM
jgi:hypothetical protein